MTITFEQRVLAKLGLFTAMDCFQYLSHQTKRLNPREAILFFRDGRIKILDHGFSDGGQQLQCLFDTKRSSFRPAGRVGKKYLFEQVGEEYDIYETDPLGKVHG